MNVLYKRLEQSTAYVDSATALSDISKIRVTLSEGKWHDYSGMFSPKDVIAIEFHYLITAIYVSLKLTVLPIRCTICTICHNVIF